MYIPYRCLNALYVLSCLHDGVSGLQSRVQPSRAMRKISKPNTVMVMCTMRPMNVSNNAAAVITGQMLGAGLAVRARRGSSWVASAAFAACGAGALSRSRFSIVACRVRASNGLVKQVMRAWAGCVAGVAGVAWVAE